MFIGVKDLISELKEPFDRLGKATRKAKANIRDRGEKADKETLQSEIDLVIAEWDRKRKIGEDTHKKLSDKELKSNKNAVYEGYSLKAFDDSNLYTKEDSKLENNKTYLEKKLVSNKYGIIGYADKIDVSRGTISITDYKVTDKLYRTSSFKADNGFQILGEKMFDPLDHLDVCNYNDAVLQLSLYMYLAWENNKKLKIGKLYIRHLKLNEHGKLVKDELVPVPYMKSDVIKILKYRKLNEG